MSRKEHLVIKKKTQKIVLCFLLVATMVLSTGFTQNNIHTVTISVDGKIMETRTTHTSPDVILARAGVKLDSKDEYTLKKTDNHTQIIVHRAVPVSITYEGQQKTIMTSKPTVGDMLLEEGYHLEDIVANPGMDTKIQENLHINVDKTAAKKAEEAALQQGEQEASFEAMSRGAHRYANAITMEATAYLPSDGDGSGITASGLMAGYGIAAVDPNVIPLGTRLYIPGYGEAIAADTGGAIYGDRIGLCMESYGEAMAFGRRDVTVYVLN